MKSIQDIEPNETCLCTHCQDAGHMSCQDKQTHQKYTKKYIVCHGKEMKSIQEIRDKLKEIGSPFESRYDGAAYYSVYNSSHELVSRHFEESGDYPHKFINFIAEAPQLISDLCDRLEEAKKALEFYANAPVFDHQCDIDDYGIINGKAMCGGKIAREALEAIK